ncbi:MAG: formyltransferase family protein [Rhodovarius sp.]|nr:formyltransferase family protein [Rhodovarius sp.]
MRIALCTLEAYASARAVRDFVRRDPSRIALIILSDPFRPAMGGRVGQVRRHLARSGPAILPYLAVNFLLPGLLCRRDRLSDLARAHNIPWHVSRDVNGAATRAAIRAAAPDLILSFHFDQIFRPETLQLARLGGINVHPSVLPRHRGPIPAWYGLAEGVTGVSIHRLAERIDAGGVLVQAEVPLPAAARRSASAAAAALHDAALPLLEQALAMLPADPPPGPLLPYCPFPDAATLRRCRRQGLRLVHWCDLPASLSAPAGGW